MATEGRHGSLDLGRVRGWHRVEDARQVDVRDVGTVLASECVDRLSAAFVVFDFVDPKGAALIDEHRERPLRVVHAREPVVVETSVFVHLVSIAIAMRIEHVEIRGQGSAQLWFDLDGGAEPSPGGVRELERLARAVGRIRRVELCARTAVLRDCSQHRCGLMRIEPARSDAAHLPRDVIGEPRIVALFMVHGERAYAAEHPVRQSGNLGKGGGRVVVAIDDHAVHVGQRVDRVLDCGEGVVARHVSVGDALPEPCEVVGIEHGGSNFVEALGRDRDVRALPVGVWHLVGEHRAVEAGAGIERRAEEVGIDRWTHESGFADRTCEIERVVEAVVVAALVDLLRGLGDGPVGCVGEEPDHRDDERLVAHRCDDIALLVEAATDRASDEVVHDQAEHALFEGCGCVRIGLGDVCEIEVGSGCSHDEVEVKADATDGDGRFDSASFRWWEPDARVDPFAAVGSASVRGGRWLYASGQSCGAPARRRG